MYQNPMEQVLLLQMFPLKFQLEKSLASLAQTVLERQP